METIQHATNLITSYTDRGVLIVRIELNSLMQEMLINEVESSIMQILPNAKTALLIDCGELQLQVSSQFLSALMCIYRSAHARGTKLAVCNLSSTLKDGYEVTALTALIPAYDSVAEAIEDLKNLRVTEVPAQASSRSGMHPATERIRLSPAAIWLAAFAFLFFCSAAFMLGSIWPPAMPASGEFVPPFETSIRGTITQADLTAAVDAWVVAWPSGYQPQFPLTWDELTVLSKSRARWASLLSVTRTSAKGKFELPVRGFGNQAKLIVLILSRNPDHHQTVPQDDAKALANVIDVERGFLEQRRYKLISDLEIRPNAMTEYRWSY